MDKNYWEQFYSKQNAEFAPSLFAEYVVKNVAITGKDFVELGCGNGRDATFFAQNGYTVLAIDQCSSEILLLQNRYSNCENLKFECADFTNLQQCAEYDVVYSRFTLHSISKEEQNRVVDWAYSSLKKNGVFCVEVRGQKNEIYKVGDAVANEKDAYVLNNHYRRFLNFDEFKNELISKGFSLDFAQEDKGFAPFNGTDETFIRVIARK